MFPTPVASLTHNTAAYENAPLVKPTGFREYDARWYFEKEIDLMRSMKKVFDPAGLLNPGKIL